MSAEWIPYSSDNHSQRPVNLALLRPRRQLLNQTYASSRSIDDIAPATSSIRWYFRRGRQGSEEQTEVNSLCQVHPERCGTGALQVGYAISDPPDHRGYVIHDDEGRVTPHPAHLLGVGHALGSGLVGGTSAAANARRELGGAAA